MKFEFVTPEQLITLVCANTISIYCSICFMCNVQTACFHHNSGNFSRSFLPVSLFLSACLFHPCHFLLSFRSSLSSFSISVFISLDCFPFFRQGIPPFTLLSLPPLSFHLHPMEVPIEHFNLHISNCN